MQPKCEQKNNQSTNKSNLKKSKKMKKNNMYEAPKAEIVELNVNRNFMEDPIFDGGISDDGYGF